jgi:hypothetical protein
MLPTLELYISSLTDEEAKEHAFYEERGMPVPKKETEGTAVLNNCRNDVCRN